MNHDPFIAIQLLRNHLSTHDQTLSFLFGAGTSASINIAPPAEAGNRRGYLPFIPAVIPLTERCREEVMLLDLKFQNAWQYLLEECDELKIEKHIESILSRVRYKISAIGQNDTTLGLNRAELRELETSIQNTIFNATSPPEASFPEKIPHQQFARWVKQISRKKPIEIFTTNYDILIERALERARVPVFDGFTGVVEPFFNNDCFDNPELMPPKDWIRLWKIHGSINWKVSSTLGSKRIIRATENTSGEMIMPSHQKYDESRKQPYQALIDRFTKVLKQNSSLLVTSGYNFGDQHLDAIIYDALDNHPLTHVISLQFSDLTPESPIVKQAVGRPNLIVLGRNGGVLHGQWGTWKLKDEVDRRTASFMDIGFDSDASYPDLEEAALTGELRLGDFNYFCTFLFSMAGISEGDQ